MLTMLVSNIAADNASKLPTGDVNGDGKVNIADMATLIAILNGKATDTFGTADVDGKNGITIADVEALQDMLIQISLGGGYLNRPVDDDDVCAKAIMGK